MIYDFIEEYFNYVSKEYDYDNSGDCCYYNVTLKKNLGNYKAGSLFSSVYKCRDKIHIVRKNKRITFNLVTCIDENSES